MSNQDGQRKDDPKLQLTASGLLGEFRGDSNVSSVIAAVSARNWHRVAVSGNQELVQAFWLEATVVGLQVQGYSPSLAERELVERRLNEKQKTKDGPTVLMNTLSIARDIRERVVPAIRRQIDNITHKRHSNRHSSSEVTDRDRKDKLFETQGVSYEQAIFRLERMQSLLESLGSKPIKARKVLDHGITRYEVTELQSKVLDKKARELDHDR